MTEHTQSNKRLGAIIGVREHSFTIKNDAGDRVSLTIRFDYTQCTDNDIIGWLNANRAVIWQRPSRALTVDELKRCDDITVRADKAGHKQPSRADAVNSWYAVFRAQGMNETDARATAELAADNAELVAETMDRVKREMSQRAETETVDDETVTE